MDKELKLLLIFAAIAVSFWVGVFAHPYIKQFLPNYLTQDNTTGAHLSVATGSLLQASADRPPQDTVVIRETNNYRAKKGLAPLVTSEMLHSSACSKVEDMIKRNYWEHIAPDGSLPWAHINNTGYTYANAGENLAYGFADESSLVNGWIISPTHEENLVGDFTEIGVCSKYGDFQGGKNWVTVAHYATPAN